MVGGGGGWVIPGLTTLHQNCTFTWEFVIQRCWKAEKCMEGSGKARRNFDKWPGPVHVFLCVCFWEVTLGIFPPGFHLLPFAAPPPEVSLLIWFSTKPLDHHLLFREMAYTWLGSCVSPWVWEPWALDHSHHLAPLNLKIVTTWKLTVMFFSMGSFRTSSPGDSLSRNPERAAPGKQGEEPGYEVVQQWTRSLNIKRLLLIKGNLLSKVKEFSAFLWRGRCKSLGSLKSCLL